ncbi:MAG: flagellar biosynthesis protein FlhB [Treponema sp.]|jgi:flagellar biosynthetic protein FlhB|nr:flagellar biosynthesis protein FlhB [Treponema sp.]
MSLFINGAEAGIGVFPQEAVNIDASLQEALNIDLQWFAAEDEGRTEEPSEYKIQRTREEGRVAKSQELIGALGLLLPALLLVFLAPYMLRTCVEMLRFFLLRATELDPLRDRMVVGLFFLYLARLALPLALTAMAAGIFANLIQTGFIFTTKPLVPDFTRIIPRFGQYFQRTLFSVEGLFNFFKSVVKMGIIGMTAFFLIRGDIEKLANLQTAGLWLGLSTVSSLAAKMLIISALLLLLLSIPDYMFQRWRYMESLKMSREEVKEERKMYEGDPYARSRIRARMRELMTQNMAVNVPKADVVITNPTHYAVALEYQLGSMPAPRVSAKGEDEVALRIRRIARDNGVPIVENKPLARALYGEAELGETIPAAYWQIVAAILSRVMGINEERRRAAREIGA